MSADERFQFFFPVWIVLALASAAFYYGCKNAQLKRTWHPRLMTASAVLFGGFVIWLNSGHGSLSWAITAFMGPALALITYLNIKLIKFCDGCGATVHNSNPFEKMEFCSKCGTSLEAGAISDGPRRINGRK